MATQQLSFFNETYIPTAYFMFLSPPEVIRNRMLEEQKIIDELLGCGKVTVSYPHVSLPWFRWGTENEDRVIESLTEPTERFDSFIIRVQGFGCFGARTIFWEIEGFEDIRKLSLLCCKSLLGNWGPKIETPHITVAKQLHRSQYEKLWNEIYRIRNRMLAENDILQFKVNELVLAKATMDVGATKRKGRLMRTSKWQIVKRFPLKARSW